MKQNFYSITKEELGGGARVPILKLGDSGEVFYELALEMIRTITSKKPGEPVVIIVPVGPVGQYPIFVRLVNEQGISLKNTWFINMDEYLTDDAQWISADHRLSFRGFMQREVYSRIRPDLIMPEEQRIFPDPQRPEQIGELIDKLGGVDAAIGGIGINGHLAFNEPRSDLSPEEFAKLPARVQEIALETRTVNSVGDLGGAIGAMPKLSVTVGMADILRARKIRLGVFRDWHRAVVRHAAYGEVSAGFPATLLQNHPDACIITNQTAAAQPF